MEAGAWAAIQASAVSRPAGTANVPPAAIMPMPTRNRKPRATLPTSPSPQVRRMPAACVAMQPCPPSDRRADRQSTWAASTRASSPGWAEHPAGLAHDTPQGESAQASHAGHMRSHGIHEARGCPCPSPDTPCGHPALRSLDADFTPPSLAPLVDNAGSRARATPRSIIPRIESGRASSRPVAVPRRRARFTQNPDQAVLAVAPPRTGRSSPEKACCSQSTIGEAM